MTIPIAFVAAMQIELFRSIGDLNYVAVATTGNLMRWVEAGYGRTVANDPASGIAFRTYTFVIMAFAGGAVVGAFSTQALGVRASWVPALLIGMTLLLFLLDERSSLPEADAVDDLAVSNDRGRRPRRRLQKWSFARWCGVS